MPPTTALDVIARVALGRRADDDDDNSGPSPVLVWLGFASCTIFLIAVGLLLWCKHRSDKRAESQAKPAPIWVQQPSNQPSATPVGGPQPTGPPVRDTATSRKLTCIGAPCRRYQPDVVRCTSLARAGTAAEDIEWSCQAELPSNLRLGRVKVSCEGWDSPGDDYVLKGSCGLQYRLVSVDPSLERDDHSLPSASDWLVPSLAIAVALYIAYRWFAAARDDRDERRGLRRGGGPGGGGDNGPPPPPYSKYGAATQQARADAPDRAAPWQPGVWTGVAAGAAAMAAIQRMGGRTEQRQYHQPDAPDRPRFDTRFGMRDDAGPSRPREATRTSTGFGGTSIR